MPCELLSWPGGRWRTCSGMLVPRQCSVLWLCWALVLSNQPCPGITCDHGTCPNWLPPWWSCRRSKVVHGIAVWNCYVYTILEGTPLSKSGMHGRIQSKDKGKCAAASCPDKEAWTSRWIHVKLSHSQKTFHDHRSPCSVERLPDVNFDGY